MKSEKYAKLIICIALVVTIAGTLAGWKLPNALLPPIERPELVLYTNWDGKGAQEIEQSLIAPLEKQLHGLANLLSLESTIFDGSAITTLTFHADADMQQMYVEALARINQVPGWPPQVPKPFIQNNASGAGATLATAMLYATTPKTEHQMIDAFRKYVEPALSKISGVEQIVTANNPIEQRVDIEFSPEGLAKYSLTIDQVTSVLTDMIDRSGDTLSLGSKDYGLLFKGQIPIAELGRLPVYAHREHIVRLGEIARIEQRLQTDWNFASIHGNRAMYMMLTPAKDVNALDAIGLIKETMDSLNNGPLASLDMKFVLSRDDSKDIKQALSLVYGSIFLGISLAAIILYTFLKNWRIVSLSVISVPVCLAVVLLAMYLGGYNLNVISLAGMALSVGLLLDAAIIVVENILRFKRTGLELGEAIARGTSQVKGAILSSTLSSIIIFLPILMMDSSESQLFEDLAFTLSSALMASVVVALVLIPILARYFLARDSVSEEKTASSEWINRLTSPARSTTGRALVILIGIPLALIYSFFAMPSIDVLPDPKQRSIRTFIMFNEPMNARAVAQRIAQPIFSRLSEAKQNQQAPEYDVTGMFCSPGNCLLYFYPDESQEWDYQTFKQWVEQDIVSGFAGTQVFSFQGSLLRFALPNSRDTQLDIGGDNLANLQLAGRDLLERLQEHFPEANISEGSPLYNQAARIEFTPKHDNLAYYGLSQAKLNNYLVAFTDGVYLGRFYAEGDTLPFYFKARDSRHIDELLKIQVMIEGHGLQPLSQLVEAKMTLAPSSLLRVNREASVSLNLTPPDNMPVGPFVEEVKELVSDFLQEHNNNAIFVSYRGSADRLSAFLNEFAEMFIVALFILVMLMYLTLKSMRLAIAIILSMPLAIAGGMLNLQLLNLFTNQNLDIITLIGFIILLGLVINNAILLAAEYDNGLSKGYTQQQAIFDAVKLRKRPIYMSTGTSIFGMLPLMLSPGDGAEIYRGLAAVIIGGMTMSALFSLSFMSALLSLKVFDSSNKHKVTPQHTVPSSI